MNARVAAGAIAVVLLWSIQVHAQPTGPGEGSDPTGAADDGAGDGDGDEVDEGDGGGQSMVEEDVQPSIPIVTSGDVQINVGGLVQVHAAPYVGDDALIENGDPATRAGFRLRRSRLGVEARFREPLRVHLAVDLLEADKDTGTVSDAKIMYDLHSWLRLSAGTGKVPFARGQLESSRSLATIERPLSIIEVAPENRLGFGVEGEFLDRRLAYLVGVYNGTEGFRDGNQYGGFLSGGRLQYTVLGTPAGLGVENGLTIGASGYYEDAPATNGFAVSGDILLSISEFDLVLEGLCDRRTPDDAPDIAPTLADEITRCGAYATATYEIPGTPMPLEAAGRAELFDDNRAIEDAGDVWLISGGFNTYLVDPFLRAQLHYIRRAERHGPVRHNDSVVLSLMGSF